MAEMDALSSQPTQDLAAQLNRVHCECSQSSVAGEPATKKASNLMHSIIGGREGPAVLEAKWAHLQWSKSLG